jgi:hypothetical protein
MILLFFGIQRPDMAEAVLKNNARIVFGAVSESHCDGLHRQCYPRFQKTMRASILRPSQNLVATACQNYAALVLKDNARIVFGAISEAFYTSIFRNGIRKQ